MSKNYDRLIQDVAEARVRFDRAIDASQSADNELADARHESQAAESALYDLTQEDVLALERTLIEVATT